MNIAIIGSGMSGLHAASTLHKLGHTITVFESHDTIGGHVQTLRVPFYQEGKEHTAIVDFGVFMFDPIDIHPYLYSLIHEKNPNTLSEIPLDFTLHIQDKNKNSPCWKTDYVNKNINKIQMLTNHLKKNIQMNGLFNPLGYWRCIKDIRLMFEFFRFHFLLNTLSKKPKFKLLNMQSFCRRFFFSQDLVENWILPQTHCWWGSPRDTFFNSSIQVFADSVLKVSQNPQYTFTQGVDKLIQILSDPIQNCIKTTSPITNIVRTPNGVIINNMTFDAALLATPPCAALKALANPDDLESSILNNFTTTTTTVYLHTDESWLPQKESWSTINLIKDERGSFTTFWVGRLHPLQPPLFVTWGDALNTKPDPTKTITVRQFLRTLPTINTVTSSESIATLQGKNRTWYCGAHVHALGMQAHSLWADNALTSGLQAAQAIHEWAGSRNH